MKKNIKDDFEAVYLRSNIVKRDIAKADPKILASSEFNKICAYMAGRCFVKNKAVLLNRGFDYPDILNIAKVFGATWVGAGYNHIDKSSKTDKNFMMRHIGHRLATLVGWILKKMKDDEIVDRSVNLTFNDKIKNTTSSAVSERYDNINLLDEINFLEEDLSEEMSLPRRYHLKNKLKIKRKLHIKNKSEQRNLTKSLKEKLDKNHGNLTDALAYYASAKSVSLDVRKVARRYCKKFNIDYKIIIEQIIERNNYDKVEFDI